jgi:hypothetical protein
MCNYEALKLKFKARIVSLDSYSSSKKIKFRSEQFKINRQQNSFPKKTVCNRFQTCEHFDETNQTKKYVLILPVNYYSASTIVTAYLNKGVLIFNTNKTEPQMYLCVTWKCKY